MFESVGSDSLDGEPAFYVTDFKRIVGHIETDEITLDNCKPKGGGGLYFRTGLSKSLLRVERAFTDTRNYLTHYNPSKELKAAKDWELEIICLKIEVLFQLHFLQLIGFSREQIDSIVVNSSQLKRKCVL